MADLLGIVTAVLPPFFLMIVGDGRGSRIGYPLKRMPR